MMTIFCGSLIISIHAIAGLYFVYKDYNNAMQWFKKEKVTVVLPSGRMEVTGKYSGGRGYRLVYDAFAPTLVKVECPRD